MPGKNAAAHHSIADWDFEHGDTYRFLSDDYYISPPTSLKHYTAVDWFGDAILCRIPATLVLPQGEVRTWLRKPDGAIFVAIFRCQTVLGTSNFHNGYGIAIFNNIAMLRREIGDVGTTRDTTPCYMAYNQWIHYRVFWYNGKTPGEQDALCVDIYREIAGEWVKEGETMYDTDNSWKDSELNRCGLVAICEPGWSTWFDDTEIWGPV